MSRTQHASTADDDGAAGARNWVDALPLVVVVLVAVPVVVLRPAIVQGTLGSPRALAIAAVVTVAILVWSALLRRFGVPALLRSVLVLVPVAVVGVLWIRPYFTDTRVDEQLPVAAVDASGVAPSEQPSQPAVAGATTASARPSPDRATSPSEPPRSEPPASASPSPSPSPSPSEPVAVSRGEFVGLDGHRAEGTAAVYRLPDGGLVVRLEDVDLQSVPEAYVHLVPGADATAPGRRSVDLGALKGNVGSSNYRVPADADIDVDRRWTVLVWCRPFASPVGAATQRPDR